ncbi:MAG: hypothetical protein K6E33_03535 [Lachnospiraceae bacterium]|nr:hypothetical protein [Lachnospiraceae bacterium]
MKRRRKIASVTAIILCIIMCLTLAMSMAGCGSAKEIELSAEDETRVKEYASGLVIKYGVGSSRLLSEEEIAESEAAKKARVNAHASEYAHSNGYVAPGTEDSKDKGGDKSSGNSSGGGDGGGETGADSYDVTTIQDFYGISGFTFNYESTEIADSYLPEGDEVNMGFLVTADAGRKLAILHFSVTNTGAEDAELDMTSYGPIFRVSLNGGGSHPVLETLLINDLSSYKGMVIAGGTQELVLISQTDEGFSESNVSKLVLSMKDAAGMSAKLLLKNDGSSVETASPADGAAGTQGATAPSGSSGGNEGANGGVKPPAGAAPQDEEIPEEGPDVPIEDIVPTGNEQST